MTPKISPRPSAEGMSEAVPPSYTREIGRQLMFHMATQRAAA